MALGLAAIAATGLVAGPGELRAESAAEVVDAPLPPERLAEIREMREGDMRKLILHPAPKVRTDVPHTDPGGAVRSLAEYRGKFVLVNFWATWCAPCRKEMGSLDRLRAGLAGERFEVVPIATSHNPLPAIRRFFEEEGIVGLPILLDPQGRLAAEYGTVSLPLSVVLDPEGREVARLIGDAEWDSDNARAVLSALWDG